MHRSAGLGREGVVYEHFLSYGSRSNHNPKIPPNPIFFSSSTAHHQSTIKNPVIPLLPNTFFNMFILPFIINHPLHFPLLHPLLLAMDSTGLCLSVFIQESSRVKEPKWLKDGKSEKRGLGWEWKKLENAFYSGPCSAACSDEYRSRKCKYLKRIVTH